jgi:excisionase family DNA binding protein
LPIFTVDEAAKELRLGSTKTRELIAAGRLRVARVDRRILVPSDSIRDFLAAHLEGGESAATSSVPVTARRPGDASASPR